jgi:hypothetical protein
MNKEVFARFLEEPSRDKLREILQHQTGEYNELDFKAEWPAHFKLAKHVLEIANYGGGCLIVGINEEEQGLIPKGVSTITDKADIFKGIEKFIPKILLSSLEILDFTYKESEYGDLKGKSFQVLVVKDLPVYVPFMSEMDGEGIFKNRIYTRRNTESIEASQQEVQIIINRRIDTGYSSTEEIELTTHLTQLKTLYDHVEKYWIVHEDSPLKGMIGSISSSMSSIFGNSKRVDNPNYPEENYEEFVARIIEKKNTKIEIELDIKNLVD